MLEELYHQYKHNFSKLFTQLVNKSYFCAEQFKFTTMSQSEEREQSMRTANDTGIYKTLLVAIIIGIIGVYLRFAFDSTVLSIVSWAILLVGTIIACRAVFRILNAK